MSTWGGVTAAEYLFVDEWDVDASAEAVFDALADARVEGLEPYARSRPQG